MKNEEEFFDATLEPEEESKPEEIYLARAKAESNLRVQSELSSQQIKHQNKKNFIKICILSVCSILLFLILAIVFFIYLKWYGVGIGCAIMGIIVSQLWVHFFKKWFKHNEDSENKDFINEINNQNENNFTDLPNA